MRPAVLRSSAASARLSARPRPVLIPRAVPRTVALRNVRYQSSGGGAGDALQGQGLVLGALALIAAGGFYYLKPVRDAAAKIDNALESVKQAGAQAMDTAKQATASAVDTAKEGAKAVGIDSPDSLDGIAKAVLPASAFAIWNQVKKADFGGILANLKDQDLQGTMDQLKKVGGDDVKKVIEKVQAKLDAAGGKVEKMDWKALAQDLSKEYGGQYQQYIDFLVGKVPSMDDFNKYIDDAKKVGKEELKKLDESADKIWKSVEKASKEGKSVGDAFVQGVKDAAPGDVDKFTAELKQTAKNAGLPADWIENYIRQKAVDNIDSAEAWAKEFESKIRLAARWMPVDADVVSDKVSEFSPALGHIVKQLLDQVEDKAEDGKKMVEKGAKEARKMVEDKGEDAKKAVKK